MARAFRLRMQENEPLLRMGQISTKKSQSFQRQGANAKIFARNRPDNKEF